MRVAVLSADARPAGPALLESSGHESGRNQWEAEVTRVSPSAESSTPGQDPTPGDAALTSAAGSSGAAVQAHPAPSPTQPASAGWAVSRLRVLLSAGMLVALVALAASFIPGGHPQGAIAEPPAATATATLAPTPTPSPTPTATATPGVTLLPGFALYQDGASGYALQYPVEWPKPSTDPSLGVQFADSSNLDAARYIVQVNQPDPLTSGVGSGPDPNTAAANWVNFELTNFQQTEEAHGFTFARQPGPIPTTMIGGQQWQAGAAVISGQDLTLQVRVFATIHNGKPYVINLLAASDVFDTGQQSYFGPMLSTFQFATPGS